MYCVKFENVIKPYLAFFKPYQAVRDAETYSLTYLTPSIINGIEMLHDLPINSIKRHKLQFSKVGMSEEQVKAIVQGAKKEESSTIHIKHALVNPVLYFLFENKEDAEKLYTTSIYGGQMEYLLYPREMFEITEDDFNDINGTETFETKEYDGVFCGFNRFKDNKKMYINIVRKE